MNLWLFEDSTLLAMLADAKRVANSTFNTADCHTEAATTIANILLEIEGRNPGNHAEIAKE